MFHNSWLLASGVAILSFALTGVMRRYALRRNLLDRPNARSSHTVPTPRGGGVAVVLAFTAGLLVSGATLSTSVIMALLPSGCGIALVGLIDDHGHVPARWRLLAHFIFSTWILYWIGVPKLEWMGVPLDIGGIGFMLATLYLVWMLNLYNFMDGIDGIAGIEAVTVGLGGTLVYWAVAFPISGDGSVPLIIAASAVGFLVWNFPPAKIFMGDVGSGFLGLIIGAVSLQAAVLRPVLLWSWLVLLGVFIVDATVTLIHRLLRGERVYDAHRSHAYQRASRRLGGHRPVTLAVTTINVLWLTPWALAIALGWIDGMVGLVAAYIPILALAYSFRAGATC
jgi:Fuc2NAc and GlcNAc transferase